MYTSNDGRVKKRSGTEKEDEEQIQKPTKEVVSLWPTECGGEKQGATEGDIPISGLGDQLGVAHGHTGESICDSKVIISLEGIWKECKNQCNFNYLEIWGPG